MNYPQVINPELVGTYSEKTFSGGGLVYDNVLEYRVWVKSKTSKGINIWLRSYPSFDEANKYINRIKNRKNILYTHFVALVKQKKWYEFSKDGSYEFDNQFYNLIDSERITEWDIKWLNDNIIIKQKN